MKIDALTISSMTGEVILTWCPVSGLKKSVFDTNENEINLLMTDGRLAELHEKIGKAIYGQTYSELEDKLGSLQIEFDEAMETIEYYREKAEQAQAFF